MVETSDPFPKVYEDFDHWLKSEGLLSSDSQSFAFVTCGNWDLKTMLPEQFQVSGIENVPEHFNRWINVKKSYQKSMGNFPRSLSHMLHGLGMTFEGRPHSGIDDTKNIARIVEAIGKKGGHVFDITSGSR